MIRMRMMIVMIVIVKKVVMVMMKVVMSPFHTVQQHISASKIVLMIMSYSNNNLNHDKVCN
jgi:hypothetical protein